MAVGAAGVLLMAGAAAEKPDGKIPINHFIYIIQENN